MINITDIDLYDEEVWNNICSGNVTGCFQIESRLGKTWCKKVKPKNIEDLACVLSIIRPGVLNATIDDESMADILVKRRNNQKEFESIDPSIDPILEPTYGVILYQEQAMKIAQKFANFSATEADDLRKAIGKKKADLMLELRKKFIQKAVEFGKDKEKAERIYDLIEKSARYSFNKSHAIEYAFIAYWCAYLKTKYPIQFYTNWLKHAEDKIDKQAELKSLIIDAKMSGINVVGPNIKTSQPDFVHDNDRTIYYGYKYIKSIGDSASRAIQDFIQSEQDQIKNGNILITLIKFMSTINKTALESLIKVGFFSGYGKTRTELLHIHSCLSQLTKKEITAILDYAEMSGTDNLEKILEYATQSSGRDKIFGTKRRLEVGKSILQKFRNPGRKLVDDPGLYATIEEEYLGVAINYSELSQCAEAYHATATCNDIATRRVPTNEEVVLAVKISSIREHMTKNDDRMAFLTIEDDTGVCDNVVVFPDEYVLFSEFLYTGALVLLYGKLQRGLIVTRVFEL